MNNIFAAALVLCGIVLLLCGGWCVLRENKSKYILVLFVFGLAAAGLGAYGPMFLEPYGKFLQPLFAAVSSPTKPTYSELFHKIGNGSLPPKYQEVALAYAMDRPI